MSLEQARGKTVDKRADIWAFGVVLYEMLTGRQAFGGTDICETLASVLKTDLDLHSLPAEVPRGLRRVLSRCLQKDRADRSRDIGDVRLDLAEALAAPTEDAGAVTSATVAPPAVWQRPVGIAAIVLVAVGLTGLAVWNAMRGGAVAPGQPVRFAVTLPADDSVNLGPTGGLALSPDGQTLVYAAQRDGQSQLFRRDTASTEIAPILGTERANWPFFSPDGAWIGFIETDGALKKVALTGGAVVTLAEVGAIHGGASWDEDDTILLTNPEGIFRVPDAGGEPELLVAATDAPSVGGSFTRPQVLPGGEHLLFTHAISSNWSEAEIVVESLVTGEHRVLLRGGTDARYLPSGHLVYVTAGTLFAVPFDLARQEVSRRAGGARRQGAPGACQHPWVDLLRRLTRRRTGLRQEHHWRRGRRRADAGLGRPRGPGGAAGRPGARLQLPANFAGRLADCPGRVGAGAGSLGLGPGPRGLDPPDLRTRAGQLAGLDAGWAAHTLQLRSRWRAGPLLEGGGRHRRSRAADRGSNASVPDGGLAGRDAPRVYPTVRWYGRRCVHPDARR